MKNIIYSLAVFAILLQSCETIEDRENAGPVLKADQLQVTTIQNPEGSNQVVLCNETAGAIIFYDWGTGTLTSRNKYDTIYLPFAGTSNLKFTGFCGGGTVMDSLTITVAENDDAYFDTDPAWKVLTNGGSGQTWVIARDIPGGIVGGNGPEDCTAPAWWTFDESFLSDVITDEITFDLLGAGNVTYKKGSDGSITKGFFSVIPHYAAFSAIQISGGPKFQWPQPSDGKYHFTKLTADELSVHEYANYNVVMMKRKGFTY